MWAGAQYRKSKGDGVLKELEGRKEWYDKHGQHIAITYNPTYNRKLPFLVKFPRFSSFFRQLSSDSIFYNHNEGIFNGIYYIPRNFEEVITLELGDTAARNNYGSLDDQGREFDFMNRVKDSTTYQALQDAYERISSNVKLSTVGSVKMKPEKHRTNYKQDTGLINRGKYVNDIYHFPYVKLIRK